MSDTIRRDHVALWERLEDFQIGDPESPFPFAARLARENRWTLDFAHRVIDEYKRFLFLAVAAGHPVTPSRAVDEAWHLHLLYTRSYWDELCDTVLMRPLHHDPTKGGETEDAKFTDWYARTCESYARFFGAEPPADIWPQSHTDSPARRTPYDQRKRTFHRSRIVAATGTALVLCVIAIPAFAQTDLIGASLALLVVFGVGVAGIVGLIALLSLLSKQDKTRKPDHGGAVACGAGTCSSTTQYTSSGGDSSHAVDGGGHDSGGFGGGSSDGGGSSGGCSGGGCSGGGCGGGD